MTFEEPVRRQDTMDTIRRLVAVPISFDLLDQMVRTDYVVTGQVECIEGIPPDATLVGSYTEEHSQTGYLVYSHPSFEPVEFGVSLTIMKPVFKKTAAPEQVPHA
jgi:hypothetical protein